MAQTETLHSVLIGEMVKTVLRLTERLNKMAIEAENSGSKRADEDDVIRSVVGFMHKTLNTRRNTVLSNPGFGMPSLQLSTGALDESAQAALLKQLQKAVLAADTRVSAIEATLTATKDTTVAMSCVIDLTLVSGTECKLRSSLHSDNTFEVARL